MKTSQELTTWSALAEFWREADDIDLYDAGWLFDHFYPLSGDNDGDCFEAYTALAGLAAITHRIRLGLMVASNTYRHPTVTAKMVATLDHISGGRFEFGYGAGWFEDEHGAYGLPLPPLRERFDRFDESLELIHLLLTKDSVDFAGDYYTLKGAHGSPKPVQRPHPPFVIGGRGEKRTLRSAARWANQWNYPRVAGEEDIADLSRKIEVLQHHCADLGRNPEEIEISVQLHGAEDPARLAQLSDAVVGVGADHVIVYFSPPHDVAQLVAAAEALRG